MNIQVLSVVAYLIVAGWIISFSFFVKGGKAAAAAISFKTVAGPCCNKCFVRRRR